jgi:hypothetical protein
MRFLATKTALTKRPHSPESAPYHSQGRVRFSLPAGTRTARHSARGADTRRAIENLLRTEKWVGRSDSWIAEVVVRKNATVRSVREELEATDQIDQLDKLLGQDGNHRPRTNGRKPEPKHTTPTNDY